MNNVKNVIIGLLIIVVLFLGGFICYDKFINKDDVSKESKLEETQEDNNDNNTEEVLDINSDFVKELYDMVHVNCNILDCHNYHYNNDGIINKLNTSDMNNGYKAYFGYRQIPNMYLSTEKNCGDFKNVNFGYYYCGSARNQDKSDDFPAIVLDETILKKYVEKIFGEGSYTTVEMFNTPTGDAFFYDSNSSRYVSAGIEKGGSAFGCVPGYKIESASKFGDIIYIIESETCDVNNKFKLIFKNSSSGYIFDSIEKIS